ncbi:DUF4435 domain-containing protein [Variovorax sp. PBL-E5]|uniref:DUF4435 domain-containing protein n=1 Tax=Variovorax sp. PBL-E5 TaxID=434014 RepID=UPI0013A57554|nr:DUF4435 domain-containing protein [Variovorax sp. PBL-E5]
MPTYIENLRKRREVPAVTKTEFATFASGVPADHRILVFEGRDDKIAYAHWLRRIANDFRYEALIRHNKAAVLKLHESLSGDLTGLSRRALYFVDRDFDDLQGHATSTAIFMTDCYSIENYCVTTEVFEDVLRDEFHCNGINEARAELLQLFRDVYGDFLMKTKPLNLRIYIARKLAISQDDKLPSRLNQIAAVGLHRVDAVEGRLSETVLLEREPTEVEAQALTVEFEKLEPGARYRGKFALMFFVRWLELLRIERLGNLSGIFAAYGQPQFKVRGDFSFDVLVSRVSPPPGLKEFLEHATFGDSQRTHA